MYSQLPYVVPRGSLPLYMAPKTTTEVLGAWQYLYDSVSPQAGLDVADKYWYVLTK